mmetsp:Transcript_28388/g.13136  ORF Transcript_28388/g.13136 Transcript_28388/m.13136 type:complete len:89 (+) Transcript_28388:400-666(+)|eukprot:CAMPEP_0201283810 /NCGR_PEP_ID=MMETSP1317-20130820/49014_1 /ASSEMBLY_ACC=CAM_ASM_000770 /TAXON_ID=187299 /ORGANISM="Undescribed Undescribed, Strain Undescribed" /LENGTH=88 /DNA_ID=CAMNT_0047601457 /DNA_START=344 /DNA_END=610 /DNA_ORIENTATION=-
MTKYSAKDVFFRAILLYLSNDDLVGADDALMRYCHKDPAFETSRECKLCQELVEAVRGKDREKFSTALYDHNRITPLDKWKTNVLTRV